MKRKWLLFVVAFALTFSWLGVFRGFCTDFDWSLKEELKLEASPLDVATSPDGKWIFILTPEKVLVYSTSDKKMAKEIPVKGGFDRLSYLSSENSLLLSNGSQKKIAFIELEPVHEFDFSNAAFEGPEKAPVTIVVFSDYQ